MNFNDEVSEGTNWGKKIIIWLVLLAFVIGGATWLCNKAGRTAETAFIQYEELQELYNSCSKLNTDLCNMRELSDNMCGKFSAQRINTLKTQLNRWVEDYNAKSKMWNRALWKSQTLPYQLDVNQFNCYTD